MTEYQVILLISLIVLTEQQGGNINGIGGGVIAAIAIGCLIGVLLLIFIAYQLHMIGGFSGLCSYLRFLKTVKRYKK
jgi:hypothetical protein